MATGASQIGCACPEARAAPARPCAARGRHHAPGAHRLGGIRLAAMPRGRPAVSASATASEATGPAPPEVTPIVKIDNLHDPFATVVTVQFGSGAGDLLGELLDTVGALRNLGLNIKRAKVDSSDPASRHRFYVTDAATSEKIVKSSRLEQIRLTILNNMTTFHPESADRLSYGPRVRRAASRDATEPLGPSHRNAVDTTIRIREDDTGSHSEVFITTWDRPGLLVDIVATLKDLNVNVVSAEVDTVGTEAQDEFFVTYRGEPLNASMTELVRNALQYFLSLAEIEREESY
ncbi:unnamed protein product [Ostreobium quekettii]|uniref:ACT domain-containing protein n=1 Tax=Ostreobium quekettii TaxID=121088 RepID=A0A8S1IQ01_9CHLO|nr:unnamed protein product [Ostreobium quekettii]|eukprot:evm.model.scf_47.2 EVM.evm.TU.scf_47.2   scf_47:17251-18123(-)